MNSILLTRNQIRRLVSCNGKYTARFSNCNLKNGQCKQRLNYCTNSSKSNQQTSKLKIYAGLSVGTLLTGYLTYKYLGNKQSTTITSTVQQEDESKKSKLIDDLPDEIEYLIIGGGSAGFAALRSIRANKPLSKVIVISDDSYYPYMKPPLSKELWFAKPELKKDLKFLQWNDKERSIFYAHDEFYFDLKQLKESETGGATVLRGHRAVKIDPYDQYVILDNGQILNYGKCLIATGSKGIQSDLEKNASNEVKKRILNFSGIDDFKILDRLVDEKKSIVLIGSEYLASELACSLSKKTNVTQVMESKGNLVTILPEFLAEWTSKCLQKDGVKQLTSTQVKSTEFKNNEVILNLSNGEQLKADYLIIDNGAQPNTDLAKTGNLEICPQTGGVVANAELQVRTNLWVAGDVASYYDENLGRRRSAHHDNALITGRLAGENMSGNHKIFYNQPLIWSDLGPKIGFEGVGIVDASLPTISVFTKPDKNAAPSIEGVEDELAVELPNITDDYYKGVVFYIREGIVVGLVLWNVFSKTPLARRIISENRSYEDLTELAKLFELHKSEFDEPKEQKSVENESNVIKNEDVQKS